MNKKLIIGNWKMNPVTETEAKHIANKVKLFSSKLKNTDVVICPPSVYLSTCKIKGEIKNYFLGSQTVSENIEGAHTGEVSINMLKDLGVKYVIIGHSEQREKGETDEIVSKKINTVLDAELIPVVCIGEKVRDTEGSHYEYLKQQIKNSFANVSKKNAKNVILAYEPVWAIGATEAMAPDQIYETVLFIRKIFADMFENTLAMKTKIIYGGSVNTNNAGDIIITGKVDGLLIGRVSVNVSGFAELLKFVDSI